jgi:nucleoid DNA-binding protein
MRKKEIVARLAQDLNLPQTVVVAVLEGLATLAAQEVKVHGGFNFPNLGKLKRAIRKALPERSTVAPHNGEPVRYPATAARPVLKAKWAREFCVAAGVKE